MKKRLILLVVLSIILCLFFVQESLAKYITAADETANISIARWKILVNDEDIRDENTVNTVINPVFLGNDNIAENIIAPTSEGYFDLIIDAREADVSFKYKISMSVNKNSSVKDLVATKYVVNGGEPITMDINNQTIENTVLYGNNNSTINIRVYIVWNDGDGSLMDNSADTLATTSGNSAMMNVSLNFTQVV
ncbi:putative uncharacterized protein [Clostridium sp. CAG:914]|nr:putative uncharacterized protein [Clostridium sp. CAG:914]